MNPSKQLQVEENLDYSLYIQKHMK